MLLTNDYTSSNEIRIVTIDSPLKEILNQKTEDIKEDELMLAKTIADHLLLGIKPFLPAAGLAAPQIGISKSVFIYSYDRDPKNLEVVINPQFIPIGKEEVVGWEGCLSVIESEGVWKLAKLSRYEKIQVNYMNLEGRKVEKILDGFAAKVFQHEFDHLQGTVNINRNDVIVKEFNSKEELQNFMQEIKRQDAIKYKKPD